MCVIVWTFTMFRYNVTSTYFRFCYRCHCRGWDYLHACFFHRRQLRLSAANNIVQLMTLKQNIKTAMFIDLVKRLSCFENVWPLNLVGFAVDKQVWSHLEVCRLASVSWRCYLLRRQPWLAIEYNTVTEKEQIKMQIEKLKMAKQVLTKNVLSKSKSKN